MVSGQSEDISVVLANFDLIAAVLNGNLDGTNLHPTNALAIPAAGLVIGADVNLYRSAANRLQTDDEIRAVRASGASALAVLLNAADANNTYSVEGSGKIWWGAGGASALDTNLYRSAADTLKTDDTLEVAGLTLPAWTAYIPALTSDGTAPTLGNSTVGGRYLRVGSTIFVQLVLTIGSTFTPGTGNYFLSLPVAASGAVGSAVCIGNGFFYDNSASRTYGLSTTIQTSGTLRMFVDGFDRLQAAVPVVPAVGDFISLLLTYET